MADDQTVEWAAIAIRRLSSRVSAVLTDRCV